MDSLRSRENRLFACALPIEHWAAQKLGQAVLVGIACRLLLPAKPVISFGFAGALANYLPVATVVDATKVVDEDGKVLWEGKPLGIRGACTGVVLGASRIINSVEERTRLCKQSGADIVDMESGIYARSGLLRGCIRVVSDTPSQQLGSVASLWWGYLALKALQKVAF